MDIDPAVLRPPATRGPLWLAISVFALGIACTAAGSVLLYDAAIQHDRQRFEDEASSRARQLDLAIELALKSLDAVRALLDSNVSLDAAQFDRFARSDASRQSGTLALGWAQRVTPKDRAAFEADLASQLGRTNAHIYESTGHGLRRTSPARDELYPVRNLAAIRGREIEPGLDLATLSSRRQAILAAIERDGPAVTKVRRADAWGEPGELIVQAFLPVWPQPRDEAHGALGVAMGVFSVSDIFRRVFGTSPDMLQVAIFDRSAPAAEQRVFSIGFDDGPLGEAEFSARLGSDGIERPFRFADRQWVAHFRPATNGVSNARLLWPLAGLAAGLGLTTLLAIWLFAAQARGIQVFRLSRELDDVQRRLVDERVALEVQRQLQVQAREAAQARSSFLQAATHDLRQPLHALSLYLSLLGDEPSRGQDPVFMTQLQQSAAALQGLFDALLDIGRLESGQMEPQPRTFALKPLLLGLLDESRVTAQRKGLRLIERIDSATVLSDPLLVERVVRNLLVNALRYTDKGWVALRSRVRNGRVQIQVFDRGPGLSRAQRDRALGTPARAQHSADGGGLGLSIVRELSKHLGLKLRVVSRQGRGTVFSLDLPAAPTARTTAPQPPDLAPPDWPHGAVLVVDDDADVRNATAERLRSWGARVDEAASLAEARQYLRSAPMGPGLVMLDMRLPDGLGSELRDSLARMGAVPPPRVIWLTADPTVPENGGEIVLRKPVTALKLKSALHAALGCTTGRSD